MANFSRSQRFVFDNLIKSRKAPCFEVYSSQIQIIQEPVDYYLALHVSLNTQQTFNTLETFE